MFVPLDIMSDASAIGGSAVSQITGASGAIMGGLASVGISIASIFILFHVFTCVSSLLEGGKFQAKMLGPVAVYLLICNFTLVASPSSAFFSALQKDVSAVIKGANDKFYYVTDASGAVVYDENGNPQRDSKITKFMRSYMENRNGRIQEIQRELDKEDEEIAGDTSGAVGEEESQETANKGFIRERLSKIGNSILSTLHKWWRQLEAKFVKGLLSYELSQRNNIVYMILIFGISFLIAVVIEFFVSVVSIVMISMGGVLFGIVLAFGPITWAFSLLPGNGQVIKSWFIRLCQYALYGPLCHLVNYFCSVIFYNNVGGASAETTLGMIAVMLCNLVLLTAIPSISSWIIEGAAGGLSLSQGVQTLMSPLGWASSVSQVLESSRDEVQQSVETQQLTVLKEINNKLGRE